MIILDHISRSTYSMNNAGVTLLTELAEEIQQVDKDQKDGKNSYVSNNKDNSPFSEPTWDDWDEKDNFDPPGGSWTDTSSDSELFKKECDLGGHGLSPDSDPSKTDDKDDKWDSVSPLKNPQKIGQYKKIKTKKKEFNPWHELDKASRKTVSRRDLLRGVLRFLPKNQDNDQ